jgi:hypothetical protein
MTVDRRPTPAHYSPARACYTITQEPILLVSYRDLTRSRGFLRLSVFVLFAMMQAHWRAAKGIFGRRWV